MGDGARQQNNINCGENFSYMVKLTTIHTLLSIILSKSSYLHKLDIKTVFLYDSLANIEYMYQPLDFRSSTHPDCVCSLKKSFYDLKQAPHAYFQSFY